MLVRIEWWIWVCQSRLDELADWLLKCLALETVMIVLDSICVLNSSCTDRIGPCCAVRRVGRS